MLRKGKRITEEALRRNEEYDIREKNIIGYFSFFARYHLEWIRDIAHRYKSGNEFPVYPILILPSYYTDARDKEIAAFVSLIMKFSGDYEQIKSFRRAITDHPWKWFSEREFILLSTGNMQNKRTGGILNWKIARLMNILWMAYDAECIQKGADLENVGLYEIIRKTAVTNGFSFFGALSFLLEGCDIEDRINSARMLILVMGGSGGFSIGLWDIPQCDIKCPLKKEIKSFVRMWFPEYVYLGSPIVAFDKATSLFGFEHSSDVFYAYLAWKRLCKKNPKGCSKYSTMYTRWYSKGKESYPYEWRSIQPEYS